MVKKIKKDRFIPKNIYVCPFCESLAMHFQGTKNDRIDMMKCGICHVRTFFLKKNKDKFLQNLVLLIRGDKEVKEIYRKKKYSNYPYVKKFRCPICSKYDTRVDEWSNSSSSVFLTCINCGSTVFLFQGHMGILDYFSR